MVLDENTSLAPVNQRVLGSSPRGGADRPGKTLFLLGFFFFGLYFIPLFIPLLKSK